MNVQRVKIGSLKNIQHQNGANLFLSTATWTNIYTVRKNKIAIVEVSLEVSDVWGKDTYVMNLSTLELV